MGLARNLNITVLTAKEEFDQISRPDSQIFALATVTMILRLRARMKEVLRHTQKSLLITCILIIVSPPVRSQTPCFDTIGALNTAMQTELARIQNGATPQAAYMYNLCTNTFFDATTAILVPVLNNAMFICGNDGDRLGRCVFLGGSEQVRIEDSTVDSYPLQELSFFGITFSSFETNTVRTGLSIAAFASTTTTATFTDCSWEVR
jgi:hypothetical protein